jgi:glutamyl-tRNA synthetase
LNLNVFDDAKLWWRIVTGPVEPQIEAPDLLAAARELLPPEPWTSESWGEWTKAVRDATGAKGKALFHPLRLALTGRSDGPELKQLFPLMGKEAVEARLGGKTA